MREKEFERIKEIGKKLDWDVEFKTNENQISFKKETVIGKDININVAGNTLEEIIVKIDEINRDFDSLENAHLFIDNVVLFTEEESCKYMILCSDEINKLNIQLESLIND